ncbi:MAG: tetratricopeptide repeat protein [Alphaproteobacteria bacterium]|nr:tetratricopeptide repeat protein [Alphaproteobacteria bacterium]
MKKETKKVTKNETKKEAKKVAKKPAEKKQTAPKIMPRDNSNINPDYTDAFIREVDEDVKNDNFKVLWNKYGTYIVAFVVIAVTAAVCFDRIRMWKIEQNQIRTENYMAAAQLRENPDETIAALQKINTETKGLLSDFAKLQIANVQLVQEKTDEALATLQSIADDKDADRSVKNIALIKLVSYKVDTMSRSELETLLQPVLNDNNSWTPIAQDLLAISAIREGDIETAKQLYENILKNKDLPEGFKTKIQDMLTSISDM